MKKVLFATSALIASAGVAAAEVSLSGEAYMGIIGGDFITNDGDAQFFTDVDVKFILSGTTDNGLTFGGSIDLDESNTGAFENGLQQGGEELFVSGQFGRLTMGDTDGAFDWAMTEAIIGGAIGDINEHGGYNGNAGLDGTTNGYITTPGGVAVPDGDGQVARYEYSFGDFSVAASAEIDTGTRDTVAPIDDTGNVYGLGAKYSAAFGGVDLGFGIGYQTNDDVDLVGASIDANFANGFRAILNYSTLDTGAAATDVDHMGVAVGYTFDAVTVAVNYGKYDFDAPAAADIDGYGLIVNYDLGGGAELQAGYANTSAGGADADAYSFGLAMSF